MSSLPSEPVLCRDASLSELRPALALMLGRPGGPADAGQVEEFIKFVEARQIDLRQTQIAVSGNRVLWGALPVPSPGRTVLYLLPPGLPASPETDAAGQLINHMARESAVAGVHLAQVLLGPEQKSVRDMLKSAGFAEIAELIYLFIRPRKPAAAPPLEPGLAWEHYSAANHAQFARVITETYADSLDCPLLNGKRGIEDVIAGHQSSGRFDPAFWYMLTRRPVSPNSGPPKGSDAARALDGLGVVLVNPGNQSDVAELVYLGVVPSARGHGVGSVLIRQALASLPAMGAGALSLAVDSLNHPALRLYYRHGLSRLGSKVALLKDLRLLSDLPT